MQVIGSFLLILAAALPERVYGPHAVGYRSLQRSDLSRTLGRAPRPVRIDVWYPAAIKTGTPLTLRDYAAMDAASSAPAAELLGRSMRARRDARAAAGKYPLVVYAHTETHRKAVLGEYLASHGFVFAAPAVLGTYDREIDPSLAEIETQARDLEFTIATLAGDLPAVDATHVATAGMSFGALGALLVAMRNSEVDAVMSFDGGIGSTPNVENFGFDRSPFHDRLRMRAPILHLYGPDVPGTQLDYLRSLLYAERDFAPFAPLGHADFAGGAAFSPEQGKRDSFEAMLRTVRAFLNRTLKGADEPFPVAVEVLPPQPAPPTFDEVRDVIRTRGAAGLRAKPYPLDALRKAGSWLMDTGKPAEARDVLAIAVETHPHSARAHFGLGVALMASGDRDTARARFEKARELAATDPLLDDAARKRIIDTSTQRIEQLQRQQ